MRSAALLLIALCASCGGGHLEPEPAPSEMDAPADDETAPLPSWSQPRHAAPPSTALAGPPRETVRIETPKHVDPVAKVLRRSRRRIRNLSLHQAPVDDTLRMFASMGRFNVVIPGEVGSRKVSLVLRDVSLEGAFLAVLASARLEARVVSDNILEVRPAGAK